MSSVVRLSRRSFAGELCETWQLAQPFAATLVAAFVAVFEVADVVKVAGNSAVEV